ncbi:MAG: hypothetical protein ACRD29_13875 [Acidimicrobiales bacterium]
MSDLEQARLATLRWFLSDDNGFFQIQATRPQAVAYGLHDSPAGQLAWIVETPSAATPPRRDVADRTGVHQQDRIVTLEHTGPMAAAETPQPE